MEAPYAITWGGTLCSCILPSSWSVSRGGHVRPKALRAAAGVLVAGVPGLQLRLHGARARTLLSVTMLFSTTPCFRGVPAAGSFTQTFASGQAAELAAWRSGTQLLPAFAMRSACARSTAGASRASEKGGR